MFEPVKVTSWKCPVCSSTYDVYEDASSCLNSPTPTPRYQVGDSVYIFQRYPLETSKPFVKRVITCVYPVLSPELATKKGYTIKEYSPDHLVRYGLDKTVRVGKDMVVGYEQRGSHSDRDERQAAPEHYLYQLGDESMYGVIEEGMVDKHE